jgi:hypothetical protein
VHSAVQTLKALFDLGLWALKTFGAALFPFNNNQLKDVPVVAERLIESPWSGIDGMATAWCSSLSISQHPLATSLVWDRWDGDSMESYFHTG